MNRPRLAILISIVLLAAACGNAEPTEVGGGSNPDNSTTTIVSTTTTAVTTTTLDPDSPESKLRDARVRWADNGPDAYRMTTRQLCFCMPIEWADTVVGGEVTSHVPTTERVAYDPGARTMEGLFDEIEAAIAEGYASLDLEFDTRTGAVIRYWVDVNEMMADEEHGVEVVSFTTLSDTVDASSLTDDYGCGDGFAKGGPDQGLALQIRWNGFNPGSLPDMSTPWEPITLPAAKWTAEIRVGFDLFSNWCNDVIQQSDPVPSVVETWTVVEGVLTIDGFGPASENVATVTGSLSGAVAESPGGDRSELGDIALINSCWGCFAG